MTSSRTRARYARPRSAVAGPRCLGSAAVVTELDLVLGDGRKKGTDVGPVINQASLENVEAYVEVGKAQGATLALGGKRATGGELDHGFFFQPTIFTGVRRRAAWSRRRSSARC